MATALDVASTILAKQHSMSAMKLQKLVYYSQAWNLVWDEKPLFTDPIEAWANGPVTPVLYAKHRGEFNVSTISGGNPATLDANELETVEGVLEFYGDKSGHWLSELTHMESPWRDARAGLAPGQRGQVRITDSALIEYYSGL